MAAFGRSPFRSMARSSASWPTAKMGKRYRPFDRLRDRSRRRWFGVPFFVVLDELHFIAGLVIAEVVDQAARHENAETAFAQAQGLADHHVRRRIVRAGRMRQIG